jgi:iron complex outermembrane receptor protein
MLLSFLPKLAHAQAERPLTWLQDLTVLQNASHESKEQQDSVRFIRAEVETWMKLHPDSKIELAPAPAQPWNDEQMRGEVDRLRETVETILRLDPDHPFHLGVENVNVTASMSPLSPVATTIDQSEMRERDVENLAQAVGYLPGVTLDHYSSRGQVGVYIRGFDTRQIPIYLDGIPIFVPYDAQLDFNRFRTSDISEVQVAKGYTSALMGPNALGGAINLVTREPQNKLEGEAFIGTASGDALDSGLRLGSRTSRFFAQGTLDWLQTEYMPLPGGFPLNSLQSTDQRNNSYSQDQKYSGRVGWTPRGQDEYVFSYVNQKANYGDPSYAGSYPVCASGQASTIAKPCDNAKYWKWPVWDKQSYYFISSTGLGQSSALKLRVYYDQYPSQYNQYDSATYSTMTLSTSGITRYNDHTDGASAIFTSRLLPRNLIGSSFYFKDDTHTEGGVTGGSTLTPQPWRTDRDQTISIGIQDAITITSRLHATAGFSADHQNGLQAQNYNTLTNLMVPFTCQADPSNGSYAGCTSHVWTYNPVASLSYVLTKSDSLFATYSDKSRFAELKERYSSHFGQGLPNPDLGPEHARNWTFGYAHSLAPRTVVQADLFHSDVRDAIESANVTYTPSPCTQSKKNCKVFVNVGGEIRQGAELTVRSTPISQLTLDANYAYLNRSLTSLPSAMSFDGYPLAIPSVYLTGTPKHKALATATVRLPHQLVGVGTVRYESGTRYQLDGSATPPVKASDFATVDLDATWNCTRKLSFQTGVKNLSDRYYYYQLGYPGEGRNWFFNTHYRF